MYAFVRNGRLYNQTTVRRTRPTKTRRQCVRQGYVYNNRDRSWAYRVDDAFFFFLSSPFFFFSYCTTRLQKNNSYFGRTAGRLQRTYNGTHRMNNDGAARSSLFTRGAYHMSSAGGQWSYRNGVSFPRHNEQEAQRVVRDVL